MLERLRASLRHRVAGEGVAISAGNALSILGRLVGIRLITGLVGASVYGEIALLSGIATLASSVFCAPILQGALRFYPDAERAGHLPTLRREVARLLRWPMLVATIGLVMGGAIWSRSASGAIPFLAAGALLCSDLVRLVRLNYLNAARRQREYAVWMTVDAWARPIGAALAILIGGASSASVLFGMSAGAVLSAVGANIRPPQAQTGASDAEWGVGLRSSLASYALPMAPAAALGWVTNIGDRYVLALTHGTAETGIYAAVYGLVSQPFIAVSTVISTTLRPLLYDATSRGDTAKERQLFLVWIAGLLAVSGAGFAVFWLGARYLLTLFLGSAFSGGTVFALWIAGAYVLQGIQQAFDGRMYAHGRTTRLFLLQAVSSSVAIGGYILLIPRHGALGAAIASFASLAASCGASLILAPRFVLTRSKE